MKRARLIAPLLVAAAALAPAPGQSASQTIAFEFGRTGGTTMPFRVRIYGDGRVAVKGTAHRIERVTLSRNALDGLRKLAVAEQFFSLSRSISCESRIGGISSRYLRVHSGSRDRTVAADGYCNHRFDQLYDVVKAAAAITA